jgi:hypothetical protein
MWQICKCGKLSHPWHFPNVFQVFGLFLAPLTRSSAFLPSWCSPFFYIDFMIEFYTIVAGKLNLLQGRHGKPEVLQRQPGCLPGFLGECGVTVSIIITILLKAPAILEQGSSCRKKENIKESRCTTI